MRFLLVAPIVASLAAPALAAGQGGEILVTATRRAQPWFEVPVAASLFDAEELRQAAVIDLRELGRISPSLLVSSTSSEANGGVARIRGVGTVGDNPGLESSVAVYVDGVYRPRSGIALTELGELERIEVLRGPQGTLFGRNASAGLISISSRKPEFESLGDAEVTLGNHGQRRFFIGVTGPLAGDRLAYRLDAVMVKRDGFIRELVSNRQINNRDRILLRGQLLFSPADSVELRLIGDYANRKEECCAGVYQPISMAVRAADGSVEQTADNPVRQILESLGRPLVDDPWRRETALTPGRDFRSHVRDMGLSAQLDWDLGGASLTSVTAWRDWRSQSGQDADYTYLDLMWRDQQNRRFRTLSEEVRLNGKAFGGRLDWLLGGYAGHERLDTNDNMRFGADYQRYAECLVANRLATDAATPGLLAPGAAGCLDSGLSATALLDPALSPTLHQRLSLWSGASLPGLSGFAAAAAEAGLPGFAFDGHGIRNDRGRQTSRNLALFTHNVLTLWPDRLHLTLGGRYTDERKTLDVDFRGDNPLCAAVATDPALSWLAGNSCAINPLSTAGRVSTGGGEWTGTVALDWTPVAGLMLFGNHSLGYKAGGFNIDRAGMDWMQPALAQMQFAPEKVRASEIGVRLQLPALQLGVTAFRSVFQGFQLNSWNGTNFIVENIESCRDELSPVGGCAADRLRGGVVSTGVELEGLARPAGDLSFQAGMTYARTRYRRNLVGAGGQPLPAALVNLPGQALSNAPEWVQTAALSWTPRLSSYLGALARLDYRLQSAINTGSDLYPEKRQPAVLVVNARLGLNGDAAAWRLELFAENLFNVQYRQVSFSEPLQGGGSYAQTAANGTPATQLFGTFPAEPRLFGVSVRTKF